MFLNDAAAWPIAVNRVDAEPMRFRTYLIRNWRFLHKKSSRGAGKFIFHVPDEFAKKLKTRIVAIAKPDWFCLD